MATELQQQHQQGGRMAEWMNREYTVQHSAAGSTARGCHDAHPLLSKLHPEFQKL
jgi:hypothetical protein